MPVVRVRSAGDGAPLTEFDIPIGLLKRRPDCYVVVDSVERSVPRAATFKEAAAAVVVKPSKKDAARAAVVGEVADGE